MNDKILFVKVRSKWKPDKVISCFPYRAYDFIEFYKLCLREKGEIIGIEIDIESHCIIFKVQKKE